MRVKLVGVLLVALTATGGCVATVPVATGGSDSGAGNDASTDAGGDAEAGDEVFCECGPQLLAGNAKEVPDSARGPCAQPSCEDACGHVWPATCGSNGAYVCEGSPQQLPCEGGTD
ncbi:MAG TPA: hypothetical protein VIF15_06630 [Polyangiaceae bacterium]|jgi:hypothetical protein